MTTTAKNKNGSSKAGSENTLNVKLKDGQSQQRKLAELGLSPIVGNAVTVTTFAKASFGEIDLSETIDVMQECADKIKGGDLSDVESTLIAQAATLNTIFNELARRAALNMGEHLNATETYLRMAFKAQAQCRSTLETLAEVKYPKAATFVRQQNVAYQQQVNNGEADTGNKQSSTCTGAPAHGETSNHSNELLEAQHGERLDTRATSTASGDDSQLEAVGAIDRAAEQRRKGAQQSQC